MSSIAKASIISLVLLVLLILGVFFILNEKKGDRGGAESALTDGGGDEAGKGAAPTINAVKKGNVPPPAGDVTLTVHVLDESTKKLLPKATLVVQRVSEGDRPGERVFESGRAGAAGRGEFTVPIPSGMYQVKAQCPGYGAKTERVTLQKDKNETLTLELGRGNSISGRVLSKGDSKPIGGAKVYAYHQLGDPGQSPIEKLIGITNLPQWAGDVLAEAVSAADGTYQIDGLEKKYYTVKASAATFSPSERRDILPTREGVDFQLPLGGFLGGVVVDAAGSGIEGAKVMAHADIDSSDIFAIIETRARPPLETVESGAGGAFRFETLGAGTFNFIASAHGYQEGRFKKIRVREGENPPQRFVVPRGLTITGKVVAPSGEGVAGAKVRATKIGEATRTEQIVIKFDEGSIPTDAQGQFAFDTLEPGKYTLLAWHKDYATEQVREVEAGGAEVTITLPTGGGISGVVTEAGTGKPITGARLSVSDMQDLKKEGVSDDSGKYYIGGLNAAGQGKRFLNIHADGYARVSNLQVYIEDNKVTENQNFELQRTALVSGKVVNTAGQGVPNARVMAKRKGPAAATAITVGSSVTDAEGGYEIKDLEGGDDTTLTVWTSDYLEGSGGPFSAQAGETVQVPPIVLQLGGMVSGAVLGPDGKGIGGVMVAIRKEGEASPDINSSATTDDRGAFTLKGLPSGTVDLVAKSQHHIEEVVAGVQIEEGKFTRDVRIVLKEGAHVRGQVVDSDGAAVERAQVVVRDSGSGLKELRAETERDGSFLVENILAADAVEVEVEHADYGSWASEKVAVNTEDLKVVLPKLGSVRGIVVDSQGNPVPSFSIQPIAKENEPGRKRPVAKSFSGTDGGFEYTGIPPGTYDVHLRAPSYAVFTFPDVSVGSGVVDLGKAVFQEGGMVAGVVVDESERPVAGATVRVLGGLIKFNVASSGRISNDPSSAVTDARGGFEFRNLKGGPVTLQVKARGFVDQRVENLDPNQAQDARRLKVVLSVGGEIFGVVVDAQGNAKNGVQVFLLPEPARPENNRHGATDSEGRFRFEGLAAGKYKVTAQRTGTDRGTSPAQEVLLNANEQVEMAPLVFE